MISASNLNFYPYKLYHMIPHSPDTQNYQQVLDLFSTYVNQINHVMNNIKESMQQIFNIKFSTTDHSIHQSYASMSAHRKKTMDDLRKIASMLKGYARFKQTQKQQSATKKSKISNLSHSRNNESRVSRQSRINSEAAYSKNNRLEDYDLKQSNIPFTSFLLSPQGQTPGNSPKNQENVSKLVNYRSLRSFSKQTQVNNIEKPNQVQGLQSSRIVDPFDGSFSYNPSQTLRKRARTVQKQGSSRIESVINETQSRFKQCLVKHESGMDEIIRRNGECLEILNVIRKNINGKKQKKKQKQPSQVKQDSKKGVPRYQSMTVASKVEVRKA